MGGIAHHSPLSTCTTQHEHRRGRSGGPEHGESVDNVRDEMPKERNEQGQAARPRAAPTRSKICASILGFVVPLQINNVEGKYMYRTATTIPHVILVVARVTRLWQWLAKLWQNAIAPAYGMC